MQFFIYVLMRWSLQSSIVRLCGPWWKEWHWVTYEITFVKRGYQ